MTRSLNGFLFALALFVLAGCASQSKLSVARFDATPRPPTKRVEFFEDESQVRKPFTIIAVLSVPGEGADIQSSAMAKVLGMALDEARKLGGEAIILHRNNSGGSAATTLYKVIVFTPPPANAPSR